MSFHPEALLSWKCLLSLKCLPWWPPQWTGNSSSMKIPVQNEPETKRTERGGLKNVCWVWNVCHAWWSLYWTHRQSQEFSETTREGRQKQRERERIPFGRKTDQHFCQLITKQHTRNRNAEEEIITREKSKQSFSHGDSLAQPASARKDRKPTKPLWSVCFRFKRSRSKSGQRSFQCVCATGKRPRHIDASHHTGFEDCSTSCGLLRTLHLLDVQVPSCRVKLNAEKITNVDPITAFTQLVHGLFLAFFFCKESFTSNALLLKHFLWWVVLSWTTGPFPPLSPSNVTSAPIKPRSRTVAHIFL